jgi:hypothetical protein
MTREEAEYSVGTRLFPQIIFGAYSIEPGTYTVIPREYGLWDFRGTCLACHEPVHWRGKVKAGEKIIEVTRKCPHCKQAHTLEVGV